VRKIGYKVLKNTKFRREAVPGRGAHHRECTALPNGGTGKGDKKKTLVYSDRELIARRR